MSPLQDITLGHYLPRDSTLHRLDPRAKLGLCGLLTGAVFFPGSQFAVVCAVPALVLGVGLSRLPVWLVVRGLRPFVWLFGFTVLVHAVTTPGQMVVSVPGFDVPVTLQGLERGVQLAAQLAAAVAFSSLLTLTTCPTDLVWGLERLGAPLVRLGLPVGEFCFSLLVALRFFPLLQMESERMRLALAARGGVATSGSVGERLRTLASLAASLTRRVLRRAEQLARAMEVRGFVPGSSHSGWRTRGFRLPEWTALGFGVLTLFAAVLLRGAGGA